MWLNCFKTTEREAMTGILSLKRKPIFNHLDFLKKKLWLPNMHNIMIHILTAYRPVDTAFITKITNGIFLPAHTKNV